MSFAFISPEEARFWVDDYYATLANECEPVGYAVNPNIAFVTGFMCDRDAAKARSMGEDGLKFFAHALGHYYVFGQHQPGATDIWANYRENKIDLQDEPGPESASYQHARRDSGEAAAKLRRGQALTR